ncbi:MAG: LuxR family transcriptional regulator [Oscillospiraceae bacterium]|jgi:DNA-binding CsgD family transcriptional regulator|nr:LuxR family transcriptional regulator [Oscillospiraceae bacterium]
MNHNPILTENENKRLTFRLPLLLCFAMFAAWQFGVMAYSGTAFSIDGKTPLPIDAGNLIWLVAIGYILSITFILKFQRFVVLAERIISVIALLSAAVLFLPISPELLALAYQIQYFCCIFMIGLESSIIIDMFQMKTAIKHFFVAYVFAFAVAAILQNDIVPVPFSVFRIFMVIALAFMLIFFFKLPTDQWLRHVKKSDGLICPKRIFAGLWIYVGLVGFLSSFGLAVAENTDHGVMIFFLSAAICSAVIFILWKCFGISPVKSGVGLTGIIALSAAFSVISLFVPALSLVSCALFGCGLVAVNIGMFYGLLISKHYPSRVIAPGIVAITFIGIIAYSTLLEILRNDTTVLYIVALAVSVGMVMIYLFLEPYLGYSFRGRTFQEMIGIVAEDTDEEETATVTETESTPEDVSLHERKMQNLMKHKLQPLTRREYQVTEYIMQGFVRQEIADKMDILPGSVTKYCHIIYSKFGIHKRSDLFKLAETLDREWADEDE